MKKKATELPFVAIVATTLAAIAVSVYCLYSGRFIIFQNLFYIPIVIACIKYLKKGFIFSVALSLVYLLLIVLFTKELGIILEAVIRVFIFFVVAGIVAFLSTESVRVRTGAKENETIYRTLAENIPGKVFLKDRNSVYISCNESYAKDLKVKTEDIKGKTDYDFFPKNLAEKYREDDKRIMDSGETENIEEEYVRMKDFSRRAEKTIISTIKVAIRDQHGDVTGIMGLFWDITERKNVEDKIKAAAKDWQKTFDSIPDLIFIQDNDYNIVRANSAFVKAVNMDLKDIIGRKCYEILHKLGHPWPGCPSEESRKRTVPLVTEVDDPNIGMPLMVRVAPIVNTEGEVTGAVHIAEDITERKKTEGVRDRLFRLMEATSDFVGFADGISGKIIYINSAGRRMVGIGDKDDVAKLKISDVHPERINKLFREEIFPKAIRDGIWEGESVFLSRDGREIPVAMVLVVHKHPSGKVAQFSTISRDISERKKVERELIFNNLVLRTQQEASADGILIVGAGGNILGNNKKFIDMWGIPRDVIESRSDARYLQSVVDKLAEPEEFLKKVSFLYAARHETSLDQINLKDGRVFERYSAPMFGDKDEYYGRVWYFRDVTENRRLQFELNKLEVLRASAEIKSKFASMVSHELRSPMSVIKESVNLVRDGLIGRITSEQKDVLNTANNNIERLGRLIDNILDFQKIKSGKMELDSVEGDVGEVVLAVGKGMSFEADEKGLDLTVNIDEGIPKIIFDKDKIVQVVTNLLNNAIKFTEKGGVSITLTCENDVVHFMVEDTGCGVEAKDVDRLFQVFERLGGGGTGGKTGGTGLGLAISKEIILAHNGKIWADSEFGKGSTFHFTLPVK